LRGGSDVAKFQISWIKGKNAESNEHVLKAEWLEGGEETGGVDISVVALSLVGVQIVYLQPFFSSLISFYEKFDDLHSTFQIWTQKLVTSFGASSGSPISSSCVSSDVPPLTPSLLEASCDTPPLDSGSSDSVSFADLPQKPHSKFYYDVVMDDVAIILPKNECNDGRFLFLSFGKFEITNHKSLLSKCGENFPIWMESVVINVNQLKVNQLLFFLHFLG
jgi:hypothetical protein